ncbi:hypothetical protein [Halioxenophilus sp. WMMB6]|uniref:hypothetical protein n=1 Tax=Halioxenophilus sp. WMMB6 TaxID=3073815 RepID=UPI00295EABF3|nr:hypothetical protein [Halioxenophilus sp. WMMB6]
MKVPSPTSVVIETLYSPAILERAARELGMIDDKSTGEDIDYARKRLSRFLTHQVVDDKLLRLYFTSSNAEYSQKALATLINVFMTNASAEKQAESAQAYEFISKQVEEYKKQLAEAEKRLSDFKIQNMDGTEGQAFDRINELRSDLEELEISIDESLAKSSALKQQIEKEGVLQQARSQQSLLLTQLRDARVKLQGLQLSFQEDYPDIVTTKNQIAQIQADLAELRTEYPNLPVDPTSDDASLFEQLRSNLSSIELDTESLLRRKQSLEKLLQKESDRADKAAVDQATVAELTRDYDKTKQIYEEMLQRRENAKLSMTIDEQGQGMTYRIQEQPVVPLASQGPSPILFIAAAPFIAALLPLGLCFAYVFLDPRIRYGLAGSTKLPEGVDIIVHIPAYETQTTSVVHNRVNWVLAALVVGALVLYGYLASFWLLAD